MNTKPSTIDEYIVKFPAEIQEKLTLIRNVINEVAPGAEESIRYNMPAIKLNNQHIYFCCYKKHIGMYPMYGLEEIEVELKEYRGKDTKDAIHLQHNKPIPVDLIRKIVKLKLKQED